MERKAGVGPAEGGAHVTVVDVATMSPLVARRRVARTVRGMRARAGLSLVGAAARLDLSRSALNRLEAGQTRVSVHLARSMMDLYDEFCPGLLDTVRAAQVRGWWQEFGIGADDGIGWETGASHIREVGVSRIPDLLQTEDYARALLADARDAEVALTVLKIRQRRLADACLSVVVSESALRNPVGGPGVMRAQLAHLRDCAETVSIRVLPAPAAARYRVTSFRLLEFDQPEDSPIAFTDTAIGTMREDRPERTAMVRRFFDVVDQAALPYDAVESRSGVGER